MVAHKETLIDTVAVTSEKVGGRRERRSFAVLRRKSFLNYSPFLRFSSNFSEYFNAFNESI